MTLDHATPLPQAVSNFCRDEGFGAIIGTEVLHGGVISLTRRLTTDSKHTLVLKQALESPADLYAREAEGLQVLGAAGLPTPAVYAVAADFLLLEDCGGVSTGTPNWEQAGRAIAQLHQRTNDKFGFEHDNYLGLMPQLNPWTADGHEFFGQQRIMRYVSVPLTEQTLTAEDREGIERLVARLPELIPAQPASLLHGDLWYANLIFTAAGDPAFIDPAVYYGWGEAELSMMRQYAVAPQAFYDAYIEVRPLEDGWWERLELLYIREYLSMIAHFGNRYNTVEKLRELVAKFA